MQTHVDAWRSHGAMAAMRPWVPMAWHGRNAGARWRLEDPQVTMGEAILKMVVSHWWYPHDLGHLDIWRMKKTTEHWKYVEDICHSKCLTCHSNNGNLDIWVICFFPNGPVCFFRGPRCATMLQPDPSPISPISM